MDYADGSKRRPWAWVLLLWAILVAGIGLYVFMGLLLYDR